MSRITTHRARPTTTGFLAQRAISRDVRALILAAAAGRTSGVVLDVGCGNTPYRDLLPGWKRTGINIAIDDALPDVVGDGLRLPVKDSVAELVLCTQVIEHVQDPFLLVRELSRTLKPGGVLVLSGPMHWPLHEEPHDYWRFTRHGLSRLVLLSGLEMVEVRDNGGAIALAAICLNHLVRHRALFPIRLGINLAGLVLDRLIPIRHSTPNLTLAARKPLS